jgi:hypothetical protein
MVFPRPPLKLLLLCSAVYGGDPSKTWEAFAIYVPAAAEQGKNVTQVSCTYTVPAMPLADDGSTPKWWVGLQSADGMGVLMKPQLTWQNSTWVINTEVLDYSVVPNIKHVSKTLTVSPGDTISASVSDITNNGTYKLAIGHVDGPISTQHYKAGVAETRAYAVMEHQPKNCAALPAAGRLTLQDVHVKVGGAVGTAIWTAAQHIPACYARSVINGGDITFSWDPIHPPAPPAV